MILPKLANDSFRFIHTIVQEGQDRHTDGFHFPRTYRIFRDIKCLDDEEEMVEELILKEEEDEYVFKDYSTVAVFNCTGFHDLFQAMYDKHPELVYSEKEEDEEIADEANAA